MYICLVGISHLVQCAVWISHCHINCSHLTLYPNKPFDLYMETSEHMCACNELASSMLPWCTQLHVPLEYSAPCSPGVLSSTLPWCTQLQALPWCTQLHASLVYSVPCSPGVLSSMLPWGTQFHAPLGYSAPRSPAVLSSLNSRQDCP